MEESKKVEGVEVEETPEVVAAPAPTLDDLAAEGFGQQELKDAKDLGLVAEKAPEEKAKDEEKAKADKAAEDAKAAPKKLTDEEHKALWDRAQIETDPAKEEEKLKTFTDAEKKLYKAQKLAWSKAKVSEAERNQAREEAKAAQERIKALEEKIKKLDPDYVEGDKSETPEAKAAREAKEQQRRAEIASERSLAQEEAAKAQYEDFDEVMVLATEIFNTKGDVLKDSPKLFRKAELLARQFFTLYGQDVGPNDLSAADVAYEIGLLHPKYKKADASTAKVEKDGTAPKVEADKKLDPKVIDRAKDQRRTSASIPSGGSGKRVVSYDELTPGDVADWPQEKFAKLPEEVQEKLLRA